MLRKVPTASQFDSFSFGSALVNSYSLWFASFPFFIAGLLFGLTINHLVCLIQKLFWKLTVSPWLNSLIHFGTTLSVMVPLSIFLVDIRDGLMTLALATGMRRP